MKSNLPIPVRRVCTAGSVAWLALVLGVAQAEEKIKVVSPTKSEALPQLPAAAKSEGNRSSSTSTTLDLFRRNRVGDVEEGGGFTAPTGRSLDARSQKIILEALKANRSSGWDETEGKAEDGKGRKEGEDSFEGGDPQRDDPNDPSNRNSGRAPGEESTGDRSGTDRSGRTDRDGRGLNRSPRSSGDRRPFDPTANAARNPLLEREPRSSRSESGEKILISDPYDARKQLDRDRGLGQGTDLQDKARSLLPESVDNTRSQQFRNLIAGPDPSAGASGASAGAGLASRPPVADRNAQFRALLAPATATPATGPNLGSLTAGTGRGLSAFDAAKPSAGMLPSAGGTLPGFSASSLGTPSFLSTPLPPPPAPAAKVQPSVLPLPRRF